jgi:hypothetical protein
MTMRGKRALNVKMRYIENKRQIKAMKMVCQWVKAMIHMNKMIIRTVLEAAKMTAQWFNDISELEKFKKHIEVKENE